MGSRRSEGSLRSRQGILERLMKPWEIWTWRFPDADEHPAVILGTDDRVRLKPRVSILLCSSQRATRRPEIHELVLDEADGLDWPTLCKCDLVYAAPKSELARRRGTVSSERRRGIAERVIRGLGLAGL
jgi:mRNA-degrading endonuclease toxin of MazEF toxin-antitoxin module